MGNDTQSQSQVKSQRTPQPSLSKAPALKDEPRFSI